jgi:hypothetical protein
MPPFAPKRIAGYPPTIAMIVVIGILATGLKSFNAEVDRRGLCVWRKWRFCGLPSGKERSKAVRADSVSEYARRRA